MSELDELRRKTLERKQARQAKMRECYQYARELGFTADEARLLSFSNKEKIDRLAKLKGAEPPPLTTP